MNIKKIFTSVGGFKLLKEYANNRVLIYAFIMFLLLPKNKVGLETLREIVTHKKYLRLRKKYRNYLIIQDTEIKVINNAKVVWFCWLQGLDNAPKLVNKVYQSVCNYCKEYEIKVITNNNYSEYIHLPDYIISKWQKGIISNAHFADVLRTSLLVKYGGTWIDSTALLTGCIPNDIENSKLFFFRTYKPGSNGHSTSISNWFIHSVSGHPVLVKLEELLFLYWKKNNSLKDYFFYHMFVEMIFEKYPQYTFDMPKYTNETPHFLLFELKKEFNKEKFENIISQSFIHKLTNKIDIFSIEQNSFYDKILNID